MRFAISGATGLIGSALTSAALSAGHTVTRITRSPSRAGAGPSIVWSPEAGRLDAAPLEGHDVVVHLAGETLVGVWTAGKKQRIRDSRIKGTQLLARTLWGLERRPAVFVSASAVGIYGSRDPAERVTEESRLGTGFLADVAKQWEAAAAPAREAGIRVAYLRTGSVLTPTGGLLAVLAPIFRLGLGATFGSGEQMWPWIALEDVTGAVLHIIAHAELSGPVNLVAPEAVSNAQFTRALAAALGRLALFRVPAFAARLAPGDMADAMLLGGARVIPKKLVDSGYAFRHPQLAPALQSMFGRAREPTG